MRTRTRAHTPTRTRPRARARTETHAAGETAHAPFSTTCRRSLKPQDGSVKPVPPGSLLTLPPACHASAPPARKIDRAERKTHPRHLNPVHLCWARDDRQRGHSLATCKALLTLPLPVSLPLIRGCAVASPCGRLHPCEDQVEKAL